MSELERSAGEESPREKSAGKEAHETITLRVHGAIREITPAAWDDCAGDVNPTVSHVFLNALEESGSVTARAGWAPQHLTFEDRDGRVVGAVPMYLKSHSYGEYVFDWGWADAYERSGGRYYPKLLSAVPFTPVPGPRLLVAPGAAAETKSHLIAGMIAPAQGRQKGAARGAGRRHRDRAAERQGSDRAGVGRVLPPLSRHHR